MNIRNKILEEEPSHCVDLNHTIVDELSIVMKIIKFIQKQTVHPICG